GHIGVVGIGFVEQFAPGSQIPKVDSGTGPYCCEKSAVRRKSERGQPIGPSAIRIGIELPALLAGGNVPDSDHVVHARRCDQLAVGGESRRPNHVLLRIEPAALLSGLWIPKMNCIFAKSAVAPANEFPSFQGQSLAIG